MTYTHIFTRRELLKGLGGLAVVGTVGVAGCLGDDDGPDGAVYLPNEPDYQGFLDGNSNYKGTVDARGQSAVDVEVGVKGANGIFYFGPVALAVSPGTTVTWKWTGKGGVHNVVSENGTFDSGPFLATEGHAFSHTFDSPGVYKYVCEPHRTLGMKGVVFVALGDNGT